MAFQPISVARLTRFNSATSCDFLDMLQSGAKAKVIEESSAKPSQTIAPSSSWCPRINWFRLRGVEPDESKEPDTDLDFTAMLGTAIHRYIQSILVKNLGEDWISVPDYLKSVGLSDKCKQEQDADGFETKLEWLDLPMRMAVDGIIRLNGTYYLLEIKSCEYETFQGLTDAKPFHIEQVKAYCSRLKLNHVIFVYIERLYGAMKVFEYTFSDDALEKVDAEYKELVLLADANVAPEKPADKSRCTSSWCKYAERCKCW